MNDEEWTEHIELLVNFWDTVFLKTNTYNGDPFGPHFTIVDLKKEYFKPWIDLFVSTATEMYVPEVATLFKEKAEYYAKEFIERLGKETKNETLTFL